MEEILGGAGFVVSVVILIYGIMLFMIPIYVIVINDKMTRLINTLLLIQQAIDKNHREIASITRCLIPKLADSDPNADPTL